MEIIEDIRQSKAYGKFIEDIGWKTLITPKTHVQVFVRRLGPVGLMKVQRYPKTPDFSELTDLFHNEKIFMCKLEPKETVSLKETEAVKKKGFKISNWPLLGTKTLRVDINQEERTIFDSFKKDCRYCIKKAQSSNGLKINKNDYEQFYWIWKKSAARKKLWIPPYREYQMLINRFGNGAFCLTVNGEAGTTILTNKNAAFYYYAGATAEGTKRNFPYLVVWEAMREAKKHGCKVWDFEGIYDHRWPNKGWLGFTHFKSSFGGTEVEFPGSMEKWRWPI